MDFRSILLLLVSLVFVQSVTQEEEVRNSTAFTLDLYRSSFDGSQNSVIAPISFRILLSLIYQSTLGDTHQELKNHAYFADDIHETAESQVLTINALIANPSVKVVNKVYVRKGLELLQTFVASSANYHLEAELKDFTKSQQTADEINQFVEEQTNGLIKDLVKSENFNADTVLLLLNTLYFKADWLNQFKERSVTPRNFKSIDGTDRLIDFMVGTISYDTYECSTLNSVVVQLPYVRESNAKFWIIMPNENSNINELKDKLNPTVVNKITTSLAPGYNKIWIPKFQIESSFDGVEELKKLGINSLFDKSEIKMVQGANNLKVSKSKQKVKIIVNTKGTEAAAATYMEISRYADFHSTQPPLVIDRPFIFMVLTADSTETLFIGHFAGVE